jgi:hypothetical protein
MAAQATMDTTTKERCFQCDPCLDIGGTLSECSAVQYGEVVGSQLVSRTAVVQSL